MYAMVKIPGKLDEIPLDGISKWQHVS